MLNAGLKFMNINLLLKDKLTVQKKLACDANVGIFFLRFCIASCLVSLADPKVHPCQGQGGIRQVLVRSGQFIANKHKKYQLNVKGKACLFGMQLCNCFSSGLFFGMQVYNCFTFNLCLDTGNSWMPSTKPEFSFCCHSDAKCNQDTEWTEANK